MAQTITVIDKATHAATAVSGSAAHVAGAAVVQLALPHTQVKLLTRQGNDLVVTTADGQQIVIHGFFAHGRVASDLVLQDDNGALWLTHFSAAMWTGGSVDPAAAGVFSSIDSIDALFSAAPAAGGENGMDGCP